jgi:gliding motility-associated lipoprotein GldH
MLVLMLFLFAFTGCSDNTIINEYIDLEDGHWVYNEPINFEFTVKDASTVYTLDYYVRNSMQYDFYNLYIAYSLEDANGDTLRSSMHQSDLMDPVSGKPFGSTAGDYYDHQVPLFNELHFADTGIYRFIVKQYMRQDTLNNIYAMGLKIAPLGQKN